MRPPFRLALSMFLVSGATGLLYEVAFSKVLATIFGATAYAVSTVLAAFMAGLALGSHLGGRVAGRFDRPLVAYGVAEGLVGVMCAATPLAFDALGSAYVAMAQGSTSLATLTALRAALTFGVILVPTACMGATLPLLARAFAGESGGENRLPLLYAINTLGGAGGALLSAYLILPTLGVRGTMHAAALGIVALGLVAFFVGRRAAPIEHADPKRDTAAAAPLPRVLWVIAFASGFLVFAAEVVDTHLLTLLIGNSAYAFGLMLAAFLVCLGIGATRAPSFAHRHGERGLARGLAWVAVATAVTLPIWDQLPRLFAAAGKVVFSWSGREVVRAAVAFVILALPTLFMGTTFPLLLRRVASRASVARDVARLTVANTAGTIVGSVATGYFILPALGSQWTFVAVAAGFAALSVAAFAALPPRAPAEGRPPADEQPRPIDAHVAAADTRRRHSRATLFIAAAGVALALLVPRWDLARMTNGANVYFTYGPPPDAIELVREDVHGGVTTVVRRDKLHTMYTNGKFQGDDGPEMAAQRRFAHFPALFLTEEKRALVIGLGTGTTLGTVAAYPFQTIDVAEISPAIVEAARTFYAVPSRGAMNDGRVTLLLNDGRNVLLTAKEPYDLVTIELTSVWFAGASNLYSHEFYELVKAHLTEHGVLQQWVQLHHIRPRELAAIVRTLMAVFPHVALFEGGAQGILVASREPLVASRARLARLDGLPDIRATLDGKHLEDMLDDMVASDDDLARLADDVAKQDGGAIYSTDDNLYLEYATPKGNVLEYHSSLAATREVLERYRTKDVRARHLGD
ncbi:MAG TPA: fused MFS/spermidine synthase [Polyangiaceae bacterium]|nr:fused MFS/spermidine synthase [Polyangiaceae bacterium]